MQLELTPEEVRVLNVAVDRINKEKELAQRIFAGSAVDLKTFSGIAGKVWWLYRNEKGKS